jgi:hypothetical protein
MTTVVFVHGTGVRKDAYETALKKVQEELERLGQRLDRGITVVPCLWGDTLGSRLSAGGLSVPLYDSTLAVGAGARPQDIETVLWSMLYQDPLYELQLLALTARPAVGGIGQDEPPGKQLDERVRLLQPDDTLQTDLAEGSIAEVFDAARQHVRDAPEYRAALAGASADLGPYRTAVARAFVAQAIVLCQAEERYPAVLMDAGLRDRIVGRIVDALGDPDLSLGSWVGMQLFRLAQKLGVMNQVQRKRGALTDASYPFAGDVLLYQARGGPIRDFIRARIETAQRPVVVIAHSLGGIACVDLFATPDPAPPKVDLLVTVGSQAPFLYEIGALQSLAPGTALPADFPPWLNIYDLGDLLSYIGAGVFPNRVQDVLVDNKQPFPEAHGAYWGNPTMWKAIEQRLP